MGIKPIPTRMQFNSRRSRHARVTQTQDKIGAQQERHRSERMSRNERSRPEQPEEQKPAAILGFGAARRTAPLPTQEPSKRRRRRLRQRRQPNRLRERGCRWRRWIQLVVRHQADLWQRIERRDAASATARRTSPSLHSWRSAAPIPRHAPRHGRPNRGCRRQQGYQQHHCTASNGPARHDAVGSKPQIER